MRDQEHVKHNIEIRGKVETEEAHIAQYLKGVNEGPQVLHYMRPRIKFRTF